MKNSLKKLRGFALRHHKHHPVPSTTTTTTWDRHSHQPQPQPHWDDLAQDMEDMRECYDSLLSAAAATTNTAYEFSESLREMGSCLLEQTALNNDEEGKVLLMLGKLQFELQKLIDRYRSHIVQTITIPSESLLNELRIVEEMKQQCEEKRNVYEHMLTKQSKKRRSRIGKGEGFSSHQLQAAHDDYDDEATLLVFRLQSLKQGQSRSLLTQAARHHAAQLCFFRKALKSLEVVEPHVRVVTEQRHIDYYFTGLEEEEEDDGGEDNNDDDDGYSNLDCGELSFDFGQDAEGQDTVYTPGNLMEANLNEIQMNSYASTRETKSGSQSAPLFSEKKLDPAERIGQSPRRKFIAYVLPTPVDPKKSIAAGSGNKMPRTTAQNLWHSSPLEAKKHENVFGDKKWSGRALPNAPAILKESNNNIARTQLPPPLAKGQSLSQLNQCSTYSNKNKRQAFSGPLARSNKFASSANSRMGSMGQPQLFSGPILQNPKPLPSSFPKVSPSNSPSFVSSPRINELHELPRPPSSVTTSTSCSGSLGFSAPLVSGGHSAPLLSSHNKLSPTNILVASNAASPLPAPPQTLARSFSIPSSSQRMTILQVPQPPESPQNLRMAEDIASPPLTPISFPNLQLPSTASAMVAFQIRVHRFK